MFWQVILKFLVELALTLAADDLLSGGTKHTLSPGSFDAPTADPTRPIPVVFGTCKVQPNVIKWTDATPIKTYSGGIAGSRVAKGFTYHARMAMAICLGPVDAIEDIIVDNTRSLAAYAPGIPLYDTLLGKVTGYTPAPNHGYPVTSPALPFARPGDGKVRAMQIVADGIFGGPDQEGGIAGVVNLYSGTDVQATDVVDTVLNPTVAAGTPFDPATNYDSPMFRRVCMATFDSNDPLAPERPFYWGTQPQFKPIHFVVKRCPSRLGHGAMTNGLDANPIEAIYDIMLDDWWGLAMPGSAFGASWAADAATPQAEDLGVSLTLDDPEASGADAIAALLRVADASIYTDPLTGLIEVALVRQDYVTANLPVISQETNAHNLDWSRATGRDLPTGVKVTFTNRAKGYTSDTVEWKNPAAIDAGGGEERWITVAMPNVTDAATAAILAQRAGRAATLAMAKATCTVDRTAYALHQGSPVLVRWPKSNLPDTVMRVTAIDYGEFGAQEIGLTLVEDVFFSSGTMIGVVTGAGSGAPVTPSQLVSAPTVDATTTETASDETLTLAVTDDSGVVLAAHGVQYRTTVGGGAPSAWTDFPGAASPYSVTIPKASRATLVEWQVQYTSQAGPTDTVTGQITVAAIATPTRPQLTVVVDGATGAVTVQWSGDELTTGVKIAASATGFPTAATVRGTALLAGTTGATGTLLTLSAGQTAYISAFAYTSDATPLESQLATALGSRAAAGTAIPTGGTAGQRLAKIDATNFNTQWVSDYATIMIPLDNGASVLDATIENIARVSGAGTIVEASIVSEVAGSVSVDIYRATYAAFPAFTKISAADPVALASAQKNSDTALTGWTTALADGDFIKAVPSGAATSVTRAYIALKLQRS